MQQGGITGIASDSHIAKWALALAARGGVYGL
jgi:hypothetical protein